MSLYNVSPVRLYVKTYIFTQEKRLHFKELNIISPGNFDPSTLRSFAQIFDAEGLLSKVNEIIPNFIDVYSNSSNTHYIKILHNMIS